MSGTKKSDVVHDFLSRYLAGIVILVVNAHLPGDAEQSAVSVVAKSFGLLDGDYSDFTRGWYANVGVAMCVTMLFNAFVPHFTVLFELASFAFWRNRGLKQGAEVFPPVSISSAIVIILFSYSGFRFTRAAR